MIVRITFRTNKNENIVILFGDSYKKWFTQCEEYLCNYIRWYDTSIISKCDIREVLNVEKSFSKWKGWGGLKWCHSDIFQEELNREGVQRDEPDNPKPRKYSEMSFIEDEKSETIVKKLINQRLRHLVGCSDIKIDAELIRNNKSL